MRGERRTVSQSAVGAGLQLPSGRHPVGRVCFDLVDHEREDPYARRPRTPRRLALWGWYPARDPVGAAPGPYLPGLWRATSWLWGLNSTGARTHAHDHASPAKGPFPLVLLSPSANPPHLYSAIMQELASHGYIAVGISHTYEPMPLAVFADAAPRLARLASLGGALAPPGRRPYEVDFRERAQVVAVKAADLSFVASRLRAGDPAGGGLLPSIDRDKWAVIGHSFGGGAAVQVCLQEDPPSAGVSLDGGLWRSPDSISRAGPILQLFAEHPEYAADPAEAVRRGYFVREEYAAADRATTVGAWEMLHRGATPGRSGVVTGASHTDFCDWPMLPLRCWSPARRTRGAGEAGRIFRTIADAVLEFLSPQLHEVSGAPRAAAEGLRTGTPTELFAPSPSKVAA